LSLLILFLLWRLSSEFLLLHQLLAAGATGGAAEADEKTTVNVVMTSAGAAKIAVIKVIREITGLGLAEAKALADNGGISRKMLKKLMQKKSKHNSKGAGATVELK